MFTIRQCQTLRFLDDYQNSAEKLGRSTAGLDRGQLHTGQCVPVSYRGTQANYDHVPLFDAINNSYDFRHKSNLDDIRICPVHGVTITQVQFLAVSE